MANRPRDPNQLAKLVVDIATGETQDAVSEKKRTVPKRGRSGGLRGGTVRAARLTPEQRTDIARTAASARWNKKQLPLPKLGSRRDLPTSGDGDC
jgi:hypothetical protein